MSFFLENATECLSVQFGIKNVPYKTYVLLVPDIGVIILKHTVYNFIGFSLEAVT